MKKNWIVLCGLVCSILTASARQLPCRQDTLNGSVTMERAWWDLRHYHLTIEPDYVNRTIRGENIITYRLVRKATPTAMQIDLVQPLHIDSALVDGQKVGWMQEGNIYYIQVPPPHKGDNQLHLYYSGQPVTSVSPPWDGGLVWSRDSLGRPWISVACQYKGASLWFPCKNALYDEPEQGATISIIAPDSLQAISNGRLLQSTALAGRRHQQTWQVQNPINHYGISFYIGKYVHLTDTLPGKKGPLSVDLWVLDYHRQQGIHHLQPACVQTLRSLEKWYGPYPFYEDGFKMVDAPYLGMEHQSAIAYGSSFMKGTNTSGGDISRTGYGKLTDRIVVHEIAHEWFGNSITASDIADRWIQEGFAGLAEELLIADLAGSIAGDAFLMGRLRTIKNDRPVIGRYGINEDGSADNYMKGWAVLHMVKAMVSDSARFNRLLLNLHRRFAHQVITSQQVEQFLSVHTGRDLAVFFDQYLRSPQVPIVEYRTDSTRLWARLSACSPAFSMAVSTNLTGQQRIRLTTQWRSWPIQRDLDHPADTLWINHYYLRYHRVNATKP